jgi:hypothetical protein
MDESELERLARKRVQMKRGYLIHVLLYVSVNFMLFILWSATGRGYPWFVWPLVGWGIALVANTIVVVMELLAPEERAVRRELRRLTPRT